MPPPQTGPAVNAAFLAAVRRSDPDLAWRLHDAVPPRPFALTPLLDERDRPPSSGSARTRFEVGLLVDELFAPVYFALLADEPWRVGNTPYRRVGTEVTALNTYDDLVAAAKPVTSWGFRILTPTAFGTAKEEGGRRQRILPEPEWVFRTLFDRWHSFVGDPRLACPNRFRVLSRRISRSAITTSGRARTW